MVYMFYAYILLLSNNEYYAGHSKNLKDRLTEHKEGKVSATKSFGPVTLVYYSAFQTKEKAISFEKYLKSSSGKAFRNKRLI